jgi:hypothetical protein
MEIGKPPVDAATVKRLEYVAGLRAFADYLAQPQAANIDLWSFPGGGVTVNAFADDAESFDRQTRALGPDAEPPLVEGWYLISRRRFGPHRLDVNIKSPSGEEAQQAIEEILDEINTNGPEASLARIVALARKAQQ